MTEENMTIDEAIRYYAKALKCSYDEAAFKLIEAAFDGELPIYHQLDDGARRRIPLEELQQEINERA